MLNFCGSGGKNIKRIYNPDKIMKVRFGNYDLPNGKYSRQTKRRRWLGKESLAMLYMETMEETRKEKEKPVTIRR